MTLTVWAEVTGGDSVGRGHQPALPGYRAFEVRPRLGGGITWASSCHVGPFGPMKIGWRVTGGSMELDVLVPGGTTATVVMPGAGPHEAGPGRHHWTGAAPHGRTTGS
jgi:alpha-L-rhamnosidase